MSARLFVARALAALAITALASACATKNLCPYPNPSAVTVTPATPCLTASVEVCIDPTLVVKNGCADALYLDTAFGRFDGDASPGAALEILSGQTVHFAVRPDKATSSSAASKSFVVPGRVGTTAITFAFSIAAD